MAIVPGSGTFDDPALLRVGESIHVEVRPADQSDQAFTGEVVVTSPFAADVGGVFTVTPTGIGLTATLTGVSATAIGVGGEKGLDDAIIALQDSWGNQILDGIDSIAYYARVLDASQVLFNQADPWVFTHPTAAQLGLAPSITLIPADVRGGGTYTLSSILWSTARQTIQFSATPGGAFTDTLATATTAVVRPKNIPAGDYAEDTIIVTALNATGLPVTGSRKVRVIKVRGAKIFQVP